MKIVITVIMVTAAAERGENGVTVSRSTVKIMRGGRE